MDNLKLLKCGICSTDLQKLSDVHLTNCCRLTGFILWVWLPSCWVFANCWAGVTDFWLIAVTAIFEKSWKCVQIYKLTVSL